MPPVSSPSPVAPPPPSCVSPPAPVPPPPPVVPPAPPLPARFLGLGFGRGQISCWRRIVHREDDGILVDSNVRVGIAGTVEQRAASIDVNAVLDTLANRADEDLVAEQDRQRGILAELVAQRERGHLALAERSPVADIGRSVGLVLARAEFLLLAQRAQDLDLSRAGRIRCVVQRKRSMREVNLCARQPISGRIENVLIALLNRDSHLRFGPLLEFENLGFLMLGKVAQPFGFAQLSQREAANHRAAHLGHLVFVGNGKEQIVAQLAESAALGIFARENLRDQVRDALDRRTGRDSVIRHHHQPRTAVAGVVGNLPRSTGKRNHLEVIAAENTLDAVVQFRAHFVRRQRAAPDGG